MTVYCSLCGRNNLPYDLHHIAGHVNNALWKIIVCRSDCHNILSAWQWANRTPRNKDHIPPDEVKLQAILQGLCDALQLASEYLGAPEISIAVGALIRRLLKHNPDPMKGKEFSIGGDYPKLKANQPVRPGNGRMCGENFLRVLAAICHIMAALTEHWNPDSELINLLSQISRNLPLRWPGRLPTGDFLVAISTADEEIIKEAALKLAAEIRVPL
jgi:hypothetical protein